MSPERFVAVSSSPLVRPCADAVVAALTAGNRAVRVYEANGTGGRWLEADVLAGRVAAVIDLSLTELAAELLGVPGGAGPDRLTAAALRGVPQVIVPGGLDAVRVATTIPDRRHATFEGVDYLRTTPAENDRLGRDIANKASAARGPTTIVLPRGGLSALDGSGRPFHWPEANFALIQSLRNWLGPGVAVVEFAAHVNDAAFSAELVAIVPERSRD